MSETSQQNQTAEAKKQSSTMILIIIAVLVVIGLGLAIVSGQKTPSTQDSASTTQEATTHPEEESMVMDTPASSNPEVKDEATNAAQEGAITAINVEAGSFYYKPSEIKVKKGDKVKLVLNSVDMMHDFIIDELGVKVPITKSGDTSTVEFTADKAGTFEYYCSVGEHKAKGQVGKITVE